MRVDGFLQLFDWNGKSRKKLFSKTIDFSEPPKQKKKSNTNMPINGFHTTVNDDHTSVLSFQRSNDLNYVSSLTDGDCYSTKPPGLVAKLMGLNSLPVQSICDSSSFNVAKKLKVKRKDYHQTDLKPRVIEKFQTEILPPKSARSIPITQNKLLSPIKNSGFVSLDNQARIMEAASKIPLVGSSSSSSSLVPFSARKPSKNLKGQLTNKNRSVSLEPKPSEPVSLALQAKINVQKREGSSLNGAELVKKRSTNNVLKQNNQKQNCPASKSSISSSSQCKKPISVNNSNKTPVKSANKTVNRSKSSVENYKKEVRDKSDRIDVVSFTFTSPISRSTEKTKVFLDDDQRKNAFLHGKGDFLSTLLDKKLRELTVDDPTSVSQDLSQRINKTSIFQDKRSRDRINKDDLFSGFSSNDPQVPEETLERRKLDGHRNPSLISVFEPSFYTESCISSDTYGTEGKIIDYKSVMMEVDTELPDSVRCTESELSYVKYILSDIESMFEDFTLGRTQKIVNPRRFDQMESQRPVFEKKNEPKLRRKLVFDCVSECVDSRCRVWARGVAVVRRNDRLVEEVCNEISRWENMKDFMMDELVENDMSGEKYKKWLDFDVEAFELGVEVERRVMSSLIDEALADMLVV